MKKLFLCFILFFSYKNLFTDDTPGALDLTFNDPNGYSQIITSANQNFGYVALGFSPNGSTIYAAGANSMSYPILVSYNLDGSLNTEFGVNGIATPFLASATSCDVAVQSDGKILLLIKNNPLSMSLFRYTSSGVLDNTFGIAGRVDFGLGVDPVGIALQSNEKIIVVGKSSGYGYIYCLNSNGSFDNDFGVNGLVVTQTSQYPNSVGIDSQGNIVIGGTSSLGYCYLSRYTSTGQIDISFNVNGIVVYNFLGDYVAGFRKIVIQSDDKIIGLAVDEEFDLTTIVLRSNSDGTIDDSFGVFEGYSRIRFGDYDSIGDGLALASDGQIFITGIIIPDDELSYVLIGCLNSDGIINNDFGTSGDGYTYNFSRAVGSKAIAIQPTDGKCIVGSLVNTPAYSLSYYNLISRFDGFPVNSSLFDTEFGVNGVATIYANGASSSLNQQQVMSVRQLNNFKLMTVVSDGVDSWTVRVDLDGDNDLTYGNGQGCPVAKVQGNEVIYQMQVGDDDSLMIVGTNQISGGYVKRVLADGSMDHLFGGQGDYPAGTVYRLMQNIYAIAQLTNGDMIVVGNTYDDGVAGMISLNGQINQSFANEGFLFQGNTIAAVSVDIDNNLYFAVGYLDGETKKVRVVKTDSNGLLDIAFGDQGFVNDVIVDIDRYTNIRLALDTQNNIVVSGSLDNSSGQVGVVRLTSLGQVDYGFNNGNQFNIDFSLQSPAILTRLMTLTNSKIVVLGYQDGGEHFTDYQWFIAQLTSSGSYDVDFNENSQTPGLYTFQPSADNEQLPCFNYDAIMQTDGKIVCAGSQSPEIDQFIPLAVRILDETDVELVPQYPGKINNYPTPVIRTYGTNGIAQSNSVYYFNSGSYPVIMNLNNLFLGGKTSLHELVVGSFTPLGEKNTSYGYNGVTVGSNILNLSQGGYSAIDTNQQMLIGGSTSDQKLVVTRFTVDGQVDDSFGENGVGKTPVITDLISGGSIAVDLENRIIIGGISSDYKLVVTRFTPEGDIDTSFGSYRNGIIHYGIVKTAEIPHLTQGGFVAVDSFNSVYVGGYTSNGRLVIAKFIEDGIADISFGNAGIASTEIITDLAGMGSIALDKSLQPVIGGYTYGKKIVAARFTIQGNLDHVFNGTGVAITPFISDLIYGGSIAIDSLNRTCIGGFSSILGRNSMVVARFTHDGLIDDDFVTGGVATTGAIDYLNQGGYVVVDSRDNIYLGARIGYALAAVKLYSGDEVVVPSGIPMTPSLVKILKYGNIPSLFIQMILFDYYLNQIPNLQVRAAVKIRIDLILANYIALHENQPGFYLILNLFKIKFLLSLAQTNLLTDYPEYTDQIDTFFTAFQDRLNLLQGL